MTTETMQVANEKMDGQWTDLGYGPVALEHLRKLYPQEYTQDRLKSEIQDARKLAENGAAAESGAEWCFNPKRSLKLLAADATTVAQAMANAVHAHELHDVSNRCLFS